MFNKLIVLKSLNCGKDFEVLFVSLFGTLESLYYQFSLTDS